MWPYLSLLLLPPAAALAPRLDGRGRALLFTLLTAVLTFAIGFRYLVGCDWNMYLLFFVRAQNASLAEALTVNSPGYMLIDWLTAQAGLSVGVSNAVCALILAAGLIAFVAEQPKPWLGLLVALPVLILIAGFNATRQATAIGFLLWALHLQLRHGKQGAPLLLIALGASFHASLLVMAPLFPLMKWGVPKFAVTILIGAGIVGLLGAIFASVVPSLSSNVWLHPPSGGALFRAFPTILALLVLPIVWRRAQIPEAHRAMLYWLAAFSLFCLPLGIASPFVMDRLGMYAIPFQIALFTRLSMMAKSGMPALALDSAIAAVPVALFVGWLSFGATVACMIPYRSFLTDPRLLLKENATTSFTSSGVNDPWEPIRRHVDGERIDELNRRAAPTTGPGQSDDRLQAPRELQRTPIDGETRRR